MNQRFKLSKSNARIRDMQLAETYVHFLNTHSKSTIASVLTKSSDPIWAVPSSLQQYLEKVMDQTLGTWTWRVKDLPVKYVSCPVCKERIWIC